MSLKKSMAVCFLIMITACLTNCGPSSQIVEDTSFFVQGESAHIEGRGRIAFRNDASKSISVIALEWSSGLKDALEVTVAGQEIKALDLTSVKTDVHFYKLPTAYRPSEEVRLDIRFKLEIKTQSGGDVSLQSWYPKLWWDDLPTRDSFSVKFESPEGYTTASSGRYHPETGVYENPGVTTRFGLWLFQSIQVEEKEVEGVQIRAFYTAEGRECAMLCLETAVDAVPFYKSLHGIFPFDSLTIIPGASRPMGGYPFASALVVIHGQQAFKDRPELHWKWITAHEIGHQYWGEYVMSADEPNDYTESWMMIGMGIMADRMYTESRELGDEKHQNFYHRFTWGLKNHYDVTADAPESLKARQRYDRNNVLIHGKGYSIISALRSVLGDETFQRAYLRCVHEYGGKRISYRDLWKTAEEESGENLQWFFQQWVRSPKYLCYQITATECRPDKEGYISEITIEPKGESITMPVEVKANFKDGSFQTARTDRFFRASKIIFRSEAELETAVLDPRQRLAMLEEPLPILPEELPDR